MEEQGGHKILQVTEIQDESAFQVSGSSMRRTICPSTRDKFPLFNCAKRPCSRTRKRFLHGQVQEQELKSGKAGCLSSYYSVFVARLAIMVMLAILIGLLTILTWHFTTVYTTKSIKALAMDLRFEILQRPIVRMWNILNSTVEITMAQVKLSEYVIGTFTPPLSQSQEVQLYEAMRDITWALFASRKALDAITISYSNGHVQAFHRDQRNNNTFYIFSEPANTSFSALQNNDVPISPAPSWSDIPPTGSHGANWYREPLDPITGAKKGPPEQFRPDDLINIAAFSERQDGDALWNVTVSKSDSPLLSSALPVRHPTEKNIVAVVGVATALSSVGQLMRELVNWHGGYMYLTSQAGYLLATSTNASLLSNKTDGVKLMMAAESSNPIIRAGAEWLQREYGNELSLTREVHVENAMLGRQRYYIDSFFLKLKKLPLVGVIIIPRSYVMGDVDRRGYDTLIILISASICILVVGCVCILILTSGVSKEMKLRAELIRHFDARRRAEASSNYKSQFLANMSHELRTPMAAVIGLLDILICNECLTTEQISTVSQIRHCSTALLRLLNNILDLSKVESGKLVLEETEFDLGRELEGLVDMFSVQCIDHNIEAVLDLADDMPRIVRGDSARVVQIFANLISNSMKFTSSGHILLRGWCENSQVKQKINGSSENDKDTWFTKKLRIGQTDKKIFNDEENITLWFEVEDTGCGIDCSKWESVFESFEQADPSTTRTYGGTGLGLCIVRSLVNKMGGQIKVVQKEGPGTLMRLYLVFGTPSENSGQLSQHIQIEFDKEKLMVLLALNGNMSRLTIVRWLKENGIGVCEASGWIEMAENLSKIAGYGSDVGNIQADNRLGHATVINECESRDFVLNTTYHNYAQSLHNVFRNQPVKTQKLIVIVDARLLDLSTNAWRNQILYLTKYHGAVKFAWILNYDTPSNVKLELRRTGHFVMVNRPLYKSKLVHLLTTITKEIRLEQEKSVIKSEASKLELNMEGLNIDSTMLSPWPGWSEQKLPGKLTENISTHKKQNFQKIPEGIYLSKYGSFTNTKDRMDFLPYPINQLTDLALPFESLVKSDDKTIEDKAECLKLCTTEEAMHNSINNNNSFSERCDGGIYPEFESEIWQEDLSKNTEQSVFRGESSTWKQSDGRAFEAAESQGRNQTSWGQKRSTEILGMKEQTETSASRFLDLSGPHSLSIMRLSRPGIMCDQSLIQTSVGDCNEGSNCINLSPISERSLSQPHRMPPSNGNCKQNALEGIRILLAEDTPILQRVATIMLEKMGASVVAVGDGLEAVDTLKRMYKLGDCGRFPLNWREESSQSMTKLTLQDSPAFDLILMDCQMPNLDGYEATRAIRKVEEETHSHIPIVALTAHAMSSDEAKCLEVGMDAYLTKPIDREQMISTILSLTKKKT